MVIRRFTTTAFWLNYVFSHNYIKMYEIFFKQLMQFYGNLLYGSYMGDFSWGTF